MHELKLIVKDQIKNVTKCYHFDRFFRYLRSLASKWACSSFVCMNLDPFDMTARELTSNSMACLMKNLETASFISVIICASGQLSPHRLKEEQEEKLVA